MIGKTAGSRRLFFGFLLIVILIVSTPSTSGQLADSPWPKYMHDERHTGRSPFTGPESPEIKWVFDTGNPDVPANGSVSAPVIGGDGTIYVTSNFQGGGTLFAINPDGSLRESCPYSVQSSPAIAQDGTIYVGVNDSPDDFLYAFNPVCTEKWKRELPNPTNQQPYHVAIGPDGTVYVGIGNLAGSSKLFAINPNGTLKWTFTASGNFESTAAFLSNGYVVIASSSPGAALHVLRPTDGVELCSSSLPGPVVNHNPTIASDDTIYQGYGSASFKAFTVTFSPPESPTSCTLTPKWTFPLDPDHIIGTVALGSDGTIYAGTLDTSNHGSLILVYPNGTEKCRISFGDGAGHAVIVDSNGTAYVHVGYYAGGLTDKHLYAINPDCSEKWRIPTGGGKLSPPAMGADGTLYLSSADGKVYAIGAPSLPPVAFALTVNVAGTGNGKVSGPGIDCTITLGSASGDCSEIVVQGTTLTLTALALEGSLFKGWIGCDVVASTSIPRAGSGGDRSTPGILGWALLPALGLVGLVLVGQTPRKEARVTVVGVFLGLTVMLTACPGSIEIGTGTQCTVKMNVDRTVTATFEVFRALPEIP